MDSILISLDNALKTLFTKPRAARYQFNAPINPVDDKEAIEPLSNNERKESGALMRVNHVGEVCAQALYASQALATESKELKELFLCAGYEEVDHLAWTATRLKELNDHQSYLNPLWYAGAFGMGYLIGKLGGDRISLGFVAETERQVSDHLKSHLSLLPKNDLQSREIVQQMLTEEQEHARLAIKKGAQELPRPVKLIMHTLGKVMTNTAHYI
jgi:ubiquinone biosynthesis monooxygenase Coq7